MRIKKLLISSSDQISEKGSRRQFFGFLGMLSLIAIPSFFQSQQSKESISNEDFFLLDGWVLKKEDIYDL